MKIKELLSRKITKTATIGAALLFFMSGIFFWGGFNATMEATNTMEFCISCHEMEDNVYEEYKPTVHHSNRSGVRATCSDCHVPDPWIHKMKRKVQASNEVLHKVLGSIDTKEKFNNKRLTMAKNVWKSMKESDSRECRNCHNLESMNPVFQKPRARKQHLNSFKTGQTCIDCHKGIAHKDIRNELSDEELEELEKPNPELIREVPQMFIDGLESIEKTEAEAEEKAKAAKEAAKAQKKASEAKIQKRLNALVAKAQIDYFNAHKNDDKTSMHKGDDDHHAPIVNYSDLFQETSNAAAMAGANTLKDMPDIDVDWNGVPARKVTVFYPGQSSMEWILTGKDHGGARPFVKLGDRCVTCHDKETNKMGDLIVSGEKLEPKETIIPGKRGNIPVSVQARYDDENLYMRFEWENSPHTPAPFVEGGKMDPKNQMKLAIMFATDDVKYAGQSGCWGTCHHDLNTMPHAPEGEEVDKYIAESRGKIEIKGKRGKKRGAWNKRKDDAIIQSEMGLGHYMDIVRLKAGEAQIDDGHILADREMDGGQKTEFNAVLNGDMWIVEMKRKLNSGKPGDISMTTDKMYNFGFAIHDDYTSDRFHHVSLGYFLGFDNDKAEINAKSVK